jgi:hypothetical protein
MKDHDKNCFFVNSNCRLHVLLETMPLTLLAALSQTHTTSATILLPDSIFEIAVRSRSTPGRQADLQGRPGKAGARSSFESHEVVVRSSRNHLENLWKEARLREIQYSGITAAKVSGKTSLEERSDTIFKDWKTLFRDSKEKIWALTGQDLRKFSDLGSRIRRQCAKLEEYLNRSL